MATDTNIGKPVSRLEGKLKVTGAAKYAAEHEVSNLLHGYAVTATITKGKIRSIDDSAARALPGVIEIISHTNRMNTAWMDIMYADLDAPPGHVFKPLKNDEVVYNGQPVALVVAEDFETARYASTLIKIEYEEEAFETSLIPNLDKGRDAKKGMATALKPPPPKPKGDFEKAFRSAAARAEGEFEHGTEHHNPIELFATTVVYEKKGKLTIYNKTQGTINDQIFVANVFGLHFRDVRVIAPFVGGGFGSGLRPSIQLYLCAMAALMLKRNVRLVLDRAQSFYAGHRPPNVQHLKFAADNEGNVTGMYHTCSSETSTYEDYTEIVSTWSHRLYPAKNTHFEYKLVPLDVQTGVDMRAPGGSTGMHAIECVMDMLAEKLNMDPLELRLKNYTEKDPSTDKPYTSKELRQCYLQAAEKFGWDKRNKTPGEMKRGNRLVGHGMATGMWDAYQFPSRMELIIEPNGKLTVNNAVTDIGTGTFTVMTQIAADQFGLALEDVTFNYGDSKKPFSMFQGGSATTSSAGVAILTAARALRKKLLKAGAKANAAFDGLEEKDIIFEKGRMIVKADPGKSISLAELVAADGGKKIKAKNFAGPKILKLRKYSLGTHSACFAEVEVDKDVKTITVTRVVTAVAAGKIINPKTARSQVLGSVVWGIGKALHEETVTDHKFGRYINANLGEYHIPVHADVNDIDIIFVEERDEIINELGTKGVGEIGLVGVPAAIANAIYNATGHRFTKLPMQFDKLLD